MHVSIVQVRVDGDHDDRRTSACEVDTSYQWVSLQKDVRPTDVFSVLQLPGHPLGSIPYLPESTLDFVEDEAYIHHRCGGATADVLRPDSDD